jgi:hypothetical protein
MSLDGKGPLHPIDRILALLVPDPRKRIKGIPTVDPRTDTVNRNLLNDLIQAGFMDGTIEDGIPQVTSVTWKGLDFYNACRGENIRVRLRFQAEESVSVERVYALAVQLHGLYSQERTRWTKNYR